MTNNLDNSWFGGRSQSVSLNLNEPAPHVVLLLDLAMLGSLAMGILEVLEDKGPWYEEPFFMAALGALALLGVAGCRQGVNDVSFDDDATRLRNVLDAFKTITNTVLIFYAAIICLPIAYVMELVSFVQRGCRLSDDQHRQNSLMSASRSSEPGQPSQAGLFGCCLRDRPLADQGQAQAQAQAPQV